MGTAYLIEELWTDWMENEASAAAGWKPVGISLTKEAAMTIVEAAGKHPGSAWPCIQAGTPKRRMSELVVL